MSTLPEISDELIREILLRLPVKALVRFKTVCKAWNSIIAELYFIRRHLQQSASKYEHESSILITPHTLHGVIDEDEVWPRTFCNMIPLFLWQENQDNACLVHLMNLHEEFELVCPMSHCDGLVLFPTDTKIYIINPATSDVLKLPDAQKDEGGFQNVGFGLDPHTNTYKVAHPFYRSICLSNGTYSVGMEVFTISDDDSCWTETMEDSPYPIHPHIPIFFKGSLYWHIYKELLTSPPQGFLRFSLEDETFSFITHPSLASEGDQLDLVQLGGELCMAQYLAAEIVIWMSRSDGNHQWDQLYVISLPDAWKFQPLGMFNDGVLIRKRNHLYCYDIASQETREIVCVDQISFTDSRAHSFDFEEKVLFFFNIVTFTESLVPLTRSR